MAGSQEAVTEKSELELPLVEQTGSEKSPENLLWWLEQERS